jgi:hypothetical protein
LVAEAIVRVAASRNQKAIVKLAYAIETAMRALHRLRRDG